MKTYKLSLAATFCIIILLVFSIHTSSSIDISSVPVVAGSGGSGLWSTESSYTYHCGEIKWHKIEYFDEHGELIHTVSWLEGTTTGSWGGSYSYMIESEGTTGAMDKIGWDCIPASFWNWCTPCANPCINPCTN